MKKYIVNPGCDGNCLDNCVSENSEIRVLPLGAAGNLLVCYNHYLKEMKFRKDRNHDLFMRGVLEGSSWDIPSWKSLKVYNPE